MLPPPKYRSMILTLMFLAWLNCVSTSAVVYYVSSVSGNDENTGLSPEEAFETIDHINTLLLLPGDEVRFHCGESWQGQMLIITDSGTRNSPIVISSYPENCSNQPILSGSVPITGWSGIAANLFRADLSVGANSGRFPHGINQLFRNGHRIRLGRWPNIEGHPNGGYSTVDGHISSSTQIIDYELPAGDWTGAAIHMKGIRWYIMNREVTDSGPHRLTLNEDVTCYTGDCVDWGYFINSHIKTLDQENEWYYDTTENCVYLYTADPPEDQELEGSVVLQGSGGYLGGVILGTNLWEHVTDVVIENLTVKNWFANGITFPVNFELDDPERIVIRNNTIADVNDTGVKLCTWIWNDGDDSGWRGGENLLVENNVISGANVYGIDCFSRDSSFRGNRIENIALIENLNRDGMGCGFTGTNCTENGAGFRLKVHLPEFSGSGNTLEYNTIHRVGMQGIDVFGPENIIQFNSIEQACYSKGDCGGIRTFGGSSFNSTNAVNITINQNIIIDVPGNTDGCHPDFDALFGFGVYVDHYSDAMIISENTVANCTAAGVLIQNSRAEVTGSVLYGNSCGTMTTGQIVQAGDDAEVSLSGNTMYSIADNQRTLFVRDHDSLNQSDENKFFNPYRDASIMVQQTGYETYTLEEWRVYSGLDSTSQAHWFNLEPWEAPRSCLFYNSTALPATIRLGPTIYEDLDRNTIIWSIDIAPYSARILVDTGEMMPQVPTASPLILLMVFSAVLIGARRITGSFY